MDAKTIGLIIQGAMTSVTLVLLYVFFWRIFPKVMDQSQKNIESQQVLFTSTLDKITARHEESMGKVANSLNGLKEVVGECRYKHKQGGAQ